MRLRRRNNIKINIFLIFFLIITIFGVSYSYLNLRLTIHGTIKGDESGIAYTITPDSNPDLSINIALTNKWIESGENRYQYLINITNIGTAIMDNFTITITFKKNVDSPIVWDYDYNLQGKDLTISNTKYNLNPNQTLPISFAISSKFSPLEISTIKLSATTAYAEVTLDKFPVNFSVSSSWGSYIYQYNVTVTNKTGNKITAWQLKITLPQGTQYQSGWSAAFTVQDNVLIINNASYNGRLNNNDNTTFGLQISTNTKNFIPNSIRAFVRWYMKKTFLKIYLSFLLIYIILYRTILIPHTEIIQYIINPVIWIILALLGFLVLRKNSDYKYRWNIIYICVSSSLIYIILFYISGLFVGYTKNPYSIEIDSIIINIFSFLLILALKEYIRDILIRLSDKKLYYYLIFIILLLYDLNIQSILESIKDHANIITLLMENVIPIIITNLFIMYTCKKGGYKPVALYRLIIAFPTLIITILPKYTSILSAFFDVLFPVFTYLFIKNNIESKEKRIPIMFLGKINIKAWIITFILGITLSLFAFGAFPLTPAVILTESMEPNIKPGDMVIIKKCNIEDVKVGDIIQYKLEDYTVVHRIINIDYIKKIIITKGDNNKSRDINPVFDKQLIGKVELNIPYIGYPTYMFKKLIGKSNINVELGE